MFNTINSKLTLKPNTSTRQIERGLGKSERERKRTSSRRRARLEKLARWVSDRDVRVYFQDEGAKCGPAPSGASHDLSVYVPTNECPQAETDLDPAVWDFVFQKAELVHELGHVLYTDFDALEEHVDKIADMHGKELFKNMFNMTEDGAIERQLASDFNVGNDLELKNANLMVRDEPGQALKGGDQHVLRFDEALGCILLDWAKYNTGRAEKLLDPRDETYVFDSDDMRARMKDILPTLKALVRDVVTEPDGAERVRIVYEYFRELEEDIEEVMEEGGMSAGGLEQLLHSQPDDASVYVVKPGGEPPDDAEALEPDEDDVVIFMEPGELSGDDEEEDPGEAYGSQVEADDEGDNEAEGAMQWQKSVESTENSMEVPEDDGVEPDTWQRAQTLASRYERALRRALQAKQASEKQHNQRAGRPDTQSLWQLGYGKARVFTNERRPEKRDYAVCLLLDRSGSMGGDAGQPWIVDEAEAVTTGLALALENLGVPTAVLGVGGDVALEKSFEQSVKDAKGVLCRGYSDGGTPLGSALELASDQLERQAENPLVFAITDGEPTDESVYEDALQQATFPVVGAYFKMSEPDIDDVRGLYHRITSESKDTLPHGVESMIKRMVV